MKLWECKYHVQTSNSEFDITDWVWSTTEPSENTIGHYWKTLHQATITKPIAYLADPETKIDNAIMSNHRFYPAG